MDGMVVVMAIVACVLMIGVIAIIVALAVRSSRKQTKALAEQEAQFQAIGHKYGGNGGGGQFVATLGGQQFTTRITYAKSNPTGFEIGAVVDDTLYDPGHLAGAYRQNPRIVIRGKPEILLRWETKRDRLGKQLKLNREVQTEDTTFDKRIYIESDAPDEDVKKVLADERVRRGVVSVLELGFRQVVINPLGESLKAVYSSQTPHRIVADVLEPACNALRAVSSALPRFVDSPVKHRHLAPILATIFSSIATGVALFTIAYCRNTWRPLVSGPEIAGLLLGLLGWLLFVPIIVLLVRGHSNSFRHFLASICLLLIALPLLGMNLTLALNGALDTSPSTDHTASVHRKWSRTGKNSTTYYLELQSWHPGEQSLEVPVPYSAYVVLAPGSRAVITVGEGYFGWEWLRAVQPERLLTP